MTAGERAVSKTFSADVPFRDEIVRVIDEAIAAAGMGALEPPLTVAALRSHVARLEGIVREYMAHVHDDMPLADDVGVRAAKALQKQTKT